jgi:hypothetical protein
MNDPAVLLSRTCPTGRHPGAVVAYYIGFVAKRLMVPWPPQYLCGCVDPRKGRNAGTCFETCGGDAGFTVPHSRDCPLIEPYPIADRAMTWLDY